MNVLDTPPQPGDEPQYPEDSAAMIRATYSMVRKLERAVIGDPWNPHQHPGLISKVERVKSDLETHIMACGTNPAHRPRRVSWWKRTGIGGALITAGGFLGGLIKGWLSSGHPPPAGGH